MSFDLNILSFISEKLHHPILDRIMVFITNLGEGGAIWFAIAIILLLVKKTRKIGMVTMFSLLLCGLLNEVIIKNMIQRARPFVSNDLIELIIKKPNSYSFPSGHTAMSFAAVGVWIRFAKNNLYKVIFIVLALLMSFSRLYLMVHYPTDVLAGIVVGLLSAYATYRFFALRDKEVNRT